MALGDAPLALAARRVRDATSEALTLRRQRRYDAAASAASRAASFAYELRALIEAEARRDQGGGRA